MLRITVKSYMTQKSTPTFDFMSKWNNDTPMPLRVMYGTKLEETRGMVKMQLHGDILANEGPLDVCMKCGKPITNKVSRYFGMGPVCGQHNYVNPFSSEEELNQAVADYRKVLRDITWTGWIIKSAIISEEKLDGEDEPEVKVRGLKSDEPEEFVINVRTGRSSKVVSEYSAFISFRYHRAAVECVKELRERAYDPDTREWEIPYAHLDKFIEKQLAPTMLGENFNVTVSVKDDADLSSKVEAKIPDNFEFFTDPMPHQLEGIEYGLNHERWLLGDEQGLGKALSLDTKVYTYPSGYKLMRDIQVGDLVYNKKGEPVKVTATYYHSNVEMYRFTFSDGASVDCCKDHLWEICTQDGYKVVDTNWFLSPDFRGLVRKDNLFAGGSYKYYIDRCQPVQFDHVDVDLDPYVLGALLGDGSFRNNGVGFTSADAEIVNRINTLLPEGYALNSSKSMNSIDYNVVKLGNTSKRNHVKQVIDGLGLLNTNSHTKFVPDIYKYNSPEVRFEVLRGLFDTDGYASKDNVLQYTTVSKRLAEDVQFLVESIGGIVSWSESACGYNGKITGVQYTLTIRVDDPSCLVSLPRKKSLLHPRQFKPRRSIIKIERIENSEAKCITVDSDDHLYLIDHFVVTHNTKQIIDLARVLQYEGKIKHCLVICGVNNLKWNWKKEISKHGHQGSHILGYRKKVARRIGTKSVVGGTQDKLADLQKLEDGEINDLFLITNIESLRIAKLADKISELCSKGVIDMVVIDESHKAKNSFSLQGSGLLKIKSKYRISVSGTPMLNSPLDLYTTFKWLGFEPYSFYSFRKHFCQMGGYNGAEILGYKNMDQLQDQLRRIMLRRTKADVLNLSEKRYIEDYVEMGAAQSHIYYQVKAQILSDIDKIKASANPLSLMMRLRQATGYTGIVSSEIKESAKFERAREIVSDAVAEGKKVVIFSNWTQMIYPAAEYLKEFNPIVITGDVKDTERPEIADRFQHDESVKVILGTTPAMGTGLTLTAGSVIIFLDEPASDALREQAVDRCHRIGTHQTVDVHMLMVADTIDDRIHSLCDNKGIIFANVVDRNDLPESMQNRIINNGSDLVDFLLS